MAVAVGSPSRAAARTLGRSRRAETAIEPIIEPPNKRRKFLSAGSESEEGQQDSIGKEQVVEDSRAAEATSTVPRSRSRSSRMNLVNGNAAQEEEVEIAARSRSAIPIRPRRERPEKYYARQPTTPRMRYSNAAAAAAASQASDGYKPREERSWEDFHPELDIDGALPIFTADEVDGRTGKKDFKGLLGGRSASTGDEAKPMLNGDVEMKDVDSAPEPTEIIVTPLKRKPGRPPRRPESMLSGLGSPPAPRILPLSTHNPRERLNLPKPSFREFNHFLQYEEDSKQNKMNYVDRGMANVGYQESDRFDLPPKVLVRHSETGQVEDEAEVALRLESDGPAELTQGPQVVGRVEYDMDEQDVAWLDEINDQRKSEGLESVKPAVFEITMTQIEKEYHALEKRIPKPQPRHAQLHRPRSSSQAAVNGDPNPPGDEPDSKCSICDDGDCENANAIIFCDGCDLAVHQECYGVPFIPEGQWFCRKCKEIGRGTPTCIFCPNVDGAFKQTSTLRWSHLLCAIWIPEVTIANMTFMEPITDVDKVPKGRWKLKCYICNQMMGACIQCGNKNCYLAFHVTCARKAKLFLKMKSQHQQGIDQTALKAFCDKHVPPDWRRAHDTDNAIIEAKRWYKHAMKDRRWADSQTAALELGAPPAPDGGLVGDSQADDTIAVTKRRRNQPPKMSWRLPSGAPVVPAVVYSTVENSLARFNVRKRKEFVERACRYWTLKREARRGAALLKRLQLQLESFSSMEITRRNFAGMGAAGRPRLIRRIEFAEMLQEDMAYLTELCSDVRLREELRLQELQTLKELVDTVYFPIPHLLMPIMQKAMKLDEKTQYFKPGFDDLALQVRERYYTSVQKFSEQLTHIITRRMSPEEPIEGDIDTIQTQLNQARGTSQHNALPPEQKEVKKLAKRIFKAVKEPIEDALRKEAQLKGKEFEEEIKKLESMSIFTAAKSLDLDESPVKASSKRRSPSELSATAGALHEDEDTAMEDADDPADQAVAHLNLASKKDSIPVSNNKKKSTPSSSSGSSSRGRLTRNSTSNSATDKPPTEPLSPPMSTDSLPAATTDPSDVFANGGVPWYLTPFDPQGTTVHEERYTGRAVLREMSEELSDMDEDTLTELAVNGVGETPKAKTPVSRTRAGTAASNADGGTPVVEHAHKKKPKKKSNGWSRPRRIR